MDRERLEQIGKFLESRMVVHRNVEHNSTWTTEEKMIVDLYDNYLDLMIENKKQKEINDKVEELLIIKKARCLNEDDYVLNVPDLDEILDILNECQNEQKNLVDLGFYKDETINFKFDTSINKPVLCKRCDNYYYAYPSKKGWVYYRSRNLGERDKEIIDIPFDEWAYEVLKEVSE